MGMVTFMNWNQKKPVEVEKPVTPKKPTKRKPTKKK